MIYIPCSIDEAFAILDWFEQSEYRCPDDYDMHYDCTTLTFEINCTSLKLETIVYLKFG